MQTISRLYANEENARKAWDELKSRGFGYSHIFTPPPSSGEDATVPASADRLLDQMMRAYIVKSEAAIYARRVSEGASLVSVHAPFSGGLKATRILNRHQPIDSGVPEPTFPSYEWNEATPLSSALCLPLLAKNELPFETITGIPSVISMRYGSGAPVRPDDPAPFSSALKMPLLTQNPAPLSSFFKFPVLIKGR